MVEDSFNNWTAVQTTTAATDPVAGRRDGRRGGRRTSAGVLQAGCGLLHREQQHPRPLLSGLGVRGVVGLGAFVGQQSQGPELEVAEGVDVGGVD